MAPNIEPKKLFAGAAENVANGANLIANTAAGAGAIIAQNAAQLADNAGQAIENAQRESRKNKYHPLFQEDVDMNSLPKLVVLDDEGERKNVDVCQGAIGWTAGHANVETLHLYHQNADLLGVTFCPKAMRGGIYYLDAYSNRYLELVNYFSTIEAEKLAELKSIAFALGAKHCKIEIYEERKHASLFKAERNVAAPVSTGDEEETINIEASANLDAEWKNEHILSRSYEQDFVGGEPHSPELHWYKNDPEIKFLISTRLTGQGESSAKTYRRKLDRTHISTINATLATKLEAAMKDMKIDDNFSLTGDAKQEERQTFVYEIKF